MAITEVRNAGRPMLRKESQYEPLAVHALALMPVAALRREIWH